MTSFPQCLSRRWPLPAALAALLLAVFCIEYPLLQFTHGLVTYPWDSTYLQLATARNLAFNHTWNMNIGGLHDAGLARHASALAPFSLLYSWLLAAIFNVTGPLAAIPLVINLTAAMLLLRVNQQWLARQGVRPVTQWVILLGVIFLTPLPILAAQGMEDILQALWVVLLIYGLADWLSGGRGGGQQSGTGRPGAKTDELPGRILFYAMLVTTTRYEGILLIGVACLVLLAIRRWEAALQLAFAAVLPMLGIGLYFLHRDGHFIPYPEGWGPLAPAAATVGVLHGAEGPGTGGLVLLCVLIFLGLLLLFFRRPLRTDKHYRYILSLLTGATLLQWIIAGNIGALSGDAHASFLWHGAWLIAGVIPVAGVLIVKYGPEIRASREHPVSRGRTAGRWSVAVLVGILALPMVLKSGEAFRTTGDACIMLYRQDYQMGRFLRSYYNRESAAVNEVGAAAYLTNGRKFDLGGGDNPEGARSRQPVYDTASDVLDSLLWKERVKIAVISDKLFSPGLLQDWTKIASWQTDDVLAPGKDTLSFYAVDSVASRELKSKLQAFEPSLPPGVGVRYY